MNKIYLITNNINNKKYVGKTTKSLQTRFSQHINSKRWGRNTHIGNAIDKYGAENFSIELLEETNNWEVSEAHYIELYKTNDRRYGYNRTPGGDFNPMDVKEVRERHRKKVQSTEFREHMRKTFTGRTHSEATKEKCRQSTLNNLDACLIGWRSYNEKRKVRVGAIVGDVIIKEFDSCSDACRFVNRPPTEAGRLLRTCDKYNKDGKRSKMFGYSWTRL